MKKRKSRFTAEDWARSEEIGKRLEERIAYHQRRRKEAEQKEKP